jgi:hypothetical protein
MKVGRAELEPKRVQAATKKSKHAERTPHHFKLDSTVLNFDKLSVTVVKANNYFQAV